MNASLQDIKTLEQFCCLLYFSNKKRFTQMHAANLEIIKEYHQPADFCQAVCLLAFSNLLNINCIDLLNFFDT
jgi:hypothetical protein